MSHPDSPDDRASRRQALTFLGSLGVAAVSGCSEDVAVAGGGQTASGGGEQGGASAAGGGGAGQGGQGGGAAQGGGGAGGGGSGDDWASGGTASMSGDYPDPFTDPLGSACALTCSTTLGPCYAQTLERQDISEGYPGLPVRLALLVVDTNCVPIANAEVDIWHTGITGLYSGSDAIDFCTSNDPDAESHRYFRGLQITDANGRVDFDTCFPGWYGGRAIHIHFTVRVGSSDYVTSQLFFPDALNDEICGTHPDYEARGEPDTSNLTDGIYDPELVLESAKQSDGALLAWKVLVLRTSLGDPLCAAG